MRIITRRWWWPVLGGVFGVAIVALASRFSLKPLDAIFIAVAPLYAGIWLRDSWRKVREGHGHADESGLSIDGRMVIDRKEIHAAYMAVDGDRVTVRLTRRFLPPVDVHLDDRSVGDALLRALRPDVAGAGVLFGGVEGETRKRTALPIAAVLLFMLLRYAATSFHNHAAITVLVSPLFLPAIIGVMGGSQFLWRRSIEIGTDGVRLRGWLGTKFIAFADITGVSRVFKETVAIEQKSGPRILLQLGATYPLSKSAKADATLDADAFIPILEARRAPAKRFDIAPGNRANAEASTERLSTSTSPPRGWTEEAMGDRAQARLAAPSVGVFWIVWLLVYCGFLVRLLVLGVQTSSYGVAALVGLGSVPIFVGFALDRRPLRFFFEGGRFRAKQPSGTHDVELERVQRFSAPSPAFLAVHLVDGGPLSVRLRLTNPEEAQFIVDRLNELLAARRRINPR